MQAHEKVFEIIYQSDEVTWRRLLVELVKSEDMDPWDIDVSQLTKKYIDTVRKLKALDFRVSGKVLLAAAVLLKMKSNRLLNEDLSEFDSLLAETEEDLPEDLDMEDPQMPQDSEKRPLIPRTPQPRKRKVSVFDLVNALEKALEVKRRRVLNSIPPMNVEAPKRRKDITQIIKEVYSRVIAFFSHTGQKRMMFSQLVPSPLKEDKVFTFIPLLHLTHQRKVELEQQKHFGDIGIMLKSKREVDSELDSEG